MPHDIFLSYSRRDAAIMKRVKAFFLEDGFSLWTDEGIEPGTPSWKQAIEDGILGAGCLVAVMSPDANDSRWVRAELDFAELHRKQIYLLLARGEPGDALPFGFVTSQFVDIRTDDGFATGMPRLIRTIRKQGPDRSAGAKPDASTERPQAGGVLVVEDRFVISNRGVIATGQVTSGSFRTGDTVNLMDESRLVLQTTISSLETFRKLRDEVHQGEHVGILLAGVSRDDVRPGMRIIGSP